MSVLMKYLKGWRFRSSTPSLTEGDEINVFVAESEDRDTGLAYIGDTELRIDGAGPETVEKRVRVRVTEFDASDATGRGEFLEVVGGSSYTG